jgi:hypothetical protein
MPMRTKKYKTKIFLSIYATNKSRDITNNI